MGTALLLLLDRYLLPCASRYAAGEWLARDKEPGHTTQAQRWKLRWQALEEYVPFTTTSLV